jgi:MFS family permease
LLGLLFAIPYGILADIRGRRLVIALSLTGAILSNSWVFLVFFSEGAMPFWTIYVYPQLQYIGGGGFVLGAVTMAIVADIVPSESR